MSDLQTLSRCSTGDSDAPAEPQAARAAPAVSVQAREAEQATAGLTVFIAEDDKVSVDSLAELLVGLGGIRIVGTAASEMAAAEWLVGHQEVWDVLITDLLLLPGGSGFGLIQHARTLRKFRHVLVLSSFVTEAVARRCVALGADAVFRKTDLDELVHYVAALRAHGSGTDG